MNQTEAHGPTIEQGSARETVSNREPGSKGGLLILVLICALIIGGVAVFAWPSPKDTSILDDERIASTGNTTIEEYGVSTDAEGSSDTEEVFAITLAEGVTPDGAFGLLRDISEHNRHASGEDMVPPFMLVNSYGQPLWSLTDRFMSLDGDPGNVAVAFWLADQNLPMTWSTDVNEGKAMISLEINEDYKDLSFQRNVMEVFPKHRVSISYRDAPTVNVPAAQFFALDDIEKLINAWCDDPRTYGDISRFYFPDFTREGEHYIDARGVERNQVKLDIRMEVAADDPDFYDVRRPAARGGEESGTLIERERDRRRQIIDLLIEEGEQLVPDYVLTF